MMTPDASSLFDQGPPPPCPAPFNLAGFVLRHASAQPDKIALALLGPSRAERWSYARLEGAVRGIATGLLQRGLTPGDRVLMRLGNTPDFPLAFLGCIAAGLIPVPTSAQLSDPETARIIDILSPALILRDPAVACAETDVPLLPAAALHEMAALPPAEFALGAPDRPAYVVFSSGTSGVPRAVVHAHRAVWARQMMVAGWYDLRASDRLCHAGAFNWTFTLGTGLLDPWAAGATALIPAPGTDPAMLPLLLKRHDATLFAAAPGIFRKLLSRPLPPLPRLRHALSAGEKLPETLRGAWRAETGTEIYEAYGMSECSTFISSSPATPARRGLLGRPQPGRRIALCDGDGPVPLGEPGEICIADSDPGLMLEYLGAPEATAARRHGGWFHTGDLGRMETDGQIAYLGRADDMMNAGGFRVSPQEVEQALHDVPGLTGLAVTDVEIKADTRVIAAFYTAETDLTEALTRRAEAQLARYKQPRLFRRLDRLPTGPNGKLSRRALRQWFTT
ncbi:MAG: class I adenylate-forming enzyme family protein [Marinovum algicola]|uniref:Acyl-CoA synthetase (AMP-forming)/AMP-acid ligase II n=1 Tax=Marinovum algicola TaxID=42444 RepID=A0A975W8M3_9RHOB|nr:class I adenylate-forming enzyme family protein [Marinovum algicola]SEJ12673.1 Acyl-CoA synthetase (AMP-forming)/AMP-acid ligase II [Marinovum algicola]SLN21429.1 Benzoate--CoA ligase [Marinovum algicola]